MLDYLRAVGVPCRISEEQGEQVVWLQSAADQSALVQALAAQQSGDLPPVRPFSAPSQLAARWRELKQLPVTLSLLLLGLAGGLLVTLNPSLTWVHWFTFTDFRLAGNSIYFSGLSNTLAQAEYWRLLTPMFLHFGLFHLLFNSLWVWEMGRRIEALRSGRLLLLLTLITSLAANGLQYAMSGPSLFGGLSGVLYGYLGYIWIWQRYWPARGFGLNGGIIGFMLVWLVLCLTGVVDQFIDGSVANGAHLGGLLAGIALAAVQMLLEKIKG